MVVRCGGSVLLRSEEHSREESNVGEPNLLGLYGTYEASRLEGKGSLGEHTNEQSNGGIVGEPSLLGSYGFSLLRFSASIMPLIGLGSQLFGDMLILIGPQSLSGLSSEHRYLFPLHLFDFFDFFEVFRGFRGDFLLRGILVPS